MKAFITKAEREHGMTANNSNLLAAHSRFRIFVCAGHALVLVVALMVLTAMAAFAQQQPIPEKSDAVTIHGRVVDARGKPVAEALIQLGEKDSAGSFETNSDPDGRFTFRTIPAGSYAMTAEKGSWRSHVIVIVTSEENQNLADLVLGEHDEARPDSSGSTGQAMEFSDKPNFTVAGVTDWTAVGGHGSDTTLRTSEALAQDVLTLPEQTSAAAMTGNSAAASDSEAKLRAAQAAAPASFDANRRLGEFYLHAGRYSAAVPFLESAYRNDPSNYENTYDLALACEGVGDYSQARDHVKLLLAHRDDAKLHHLAGELDEKLGDPLAAVHEYELAAKLDPTEQNYFAWGSELLLHRAIWQAQEVFRKGTEAYPQSERMLTALGAALFAGAVYKDAAQRLCAASDLNPSDPEPYTFMGKIDIAAPDPLPCIEPRLERFARQQPKNPLANYLYAMVLLKAQHQTGDLQAQQRAETLLKKAVTLDSGLADAWLQLGILAAARRDLSEAMEDYRKAIGANPKLGEAYYRLGVAYDRTGDPARARQEFELHDQIEKAQANEVERQRKEIQQFLIVPSGQAIPASKQ